jgi:mRNA-degrading endonuclease RelE of RelBE toxin-antitoxin system
MNAYTLQIPADIERQLQKCRASLRLSIGKRLREIVEGATIGVPPRRPALAPRGPPLRFYVFEGFRVSYQVNPTTRSIIVLKLQPATG